MYHSANVKTIKRQTVAQYENNFELLKEKHTPKPLLITVVYSPYIHSCVSKSFFPRMFSWISLFFKTKSKIWIPYNNIRLCLNLLSSFYLLLPQFTKFRSYQSFFVFLKNYFWLQSLCKGFYIKNAVPPASSHSMLFINVDFWSLPEHPI